MSFKEKLVLWLVITLIIAGFFYMVSDILLPFVVALITAYFLDPATDRIEKMGFSRGAATSIICSLFFLILVIAISLLLPALYDQILLFAEKIPQYTAFFNQTVIPAVSAKLNAIDPGVIESAKNLVTEMSGYIAKFLASVVTGFLGSTIAIINVLSLIFITPIVTFYMIRDWDRIVKKVNGWLPPKHAPVIREQFRLIDRTLAGYIRGQTNVCILLGAFYALLLTFIGLDFALFIGFFTGLLSFIPYVGVVFGAVAGLLIAFFQFGDIYHITLVALVFFGGQFLEGNFVAPMLVGDKVGVHAVWIIFGMLAGASLMGIVGMLIAVPVTAIIAVLIRFLLHQYMRSPLYLEKKKPVSGKV